MSAIRDKARTILDGALPSTTVITSNGPLGSKYTEMTGLSHKALTDNWATGGIMTGCNGFTGWYGRKMGSSTYLGVFDLQGVVKKAGRPGAWVPSTRENRPQYGDIAQEHAHRAQVRRDLLAILRGRPAGVRQQFLRRLQPSPRIAAGRGPRQRALRNLEGIRIRLYRTDLRKREPDQPRAHRRQEHVRMRCEKDEHRGRRRLLECLQQRVLRMRHQRIRTGHDYDATTPFERTIRRPIDDLAHLFDLDRPGIARRDHEHVRMHAARNPRARGTAPAAVGRQPAVVNDELCAVQRLCNRNRGVARGRAGSSKQQAGREHVAMDRSRQQLDRPTMADNVPKRHNSASKRIVSESSSWVVGG